MCRRIVDGDARVLSKQYQGKGNGREREARIKTQPLRWVFSFSGAVYPLIPSVIRIKGKTYCPLG